MKKFLHLFLVFIVTGSESYAIPTLTQANSAPAIGESMTLFGADTSAQPGPAGASQIWNYNFTLGTPTTSLAIDPSNAPNSFNFPTANIVLQSASAYEYINSSASSLIQLGAGSGVQLISYGPTGINYLTYPFTYNSVATTSNFSGTHAQGTLLGNNITTGDAYGSITINGQTFSDVIRIEVVQDIDYTYTGFGNLVYHTVSYSWYDGIHKTPIMQIITSDYSGFTLGHVKIVSVGSFVSGINNINSPLTSLNFFPNPATVAANVSLSLSKSAHVVLKMYDNMGAQIFTKDLGQISAGILSESLNLDAFSKGIYVIDLITDGISNPKRFLIN